MLRLLFSVACLFASDDERAAADAAYRTATGERYYFNGGGCDFRFYIDRAAVAVDGRECRLASFHFEGWVGGMGYEQEVYWGTVGGRFCLFCRDHAAPFDPDDPPPEFPIQRGKE